MIRWSVGALAVTWLVTGCGATEADRAKADTAVAEARAARLATALAAGDSSVGAADSAVARWVLPAVLREVSGLALTSDGRLFAHGDEGGEIWEVDYRRGVLLKRFSLGPDAVTADFEGITAANGALFMIVSDGRLYEFAEGTDGAKVAYKVRDPKLKAECEFEGVAFDSTASTLLLLCKEVLNKSLQGSLVIYRWPVGGPEAAAVPLVVPMARVIGANSWKDLRPSAITVDPVTGHYVIIAAREQALIELSPTGEVVASRPLPGSHPQAEGVAITRDRILVVSDEATKEPASITLFRWRGTDRLPVPLPVR
jgi:uncharacterized protein YjiK